MEREGEGEQVGDICLLGGLDVHSGALKIRLGTGPDPDLNRV